MQIRHLPDQLSEFLQYLASDVQDNDRVPSLSELSQQLGVSIASLREQLEVARALGFVEVRPKTGIRRLPFSFRPAVEQSLAYAIASDAQCFEVYSDFRQHVEESYWYEAVSRLDQTDRQQLKDLVARALDKLQRKPAQIPHQEHRELHLLIYKRLNNTFVMGTLEAYWDLYEAIGLDVYTDFHYLEQVWAYHRKMVDAICDGRFEAGYQLLTEHMDLLNERTKASPRLAFE
jgi:DNA-binding FadR family transcriptional regulator